MWFANLPLYHSTDVKASKVSVTATPRGMTQPTSITVHVDAADRGRLHHPGLHRRAVARGHRDGAPRRESLGMPSQHPWSSKRDALELRQAFLVKCDEATIVAIRESAGEGQQSTDGQLRRLHLQPLTRPQRPAPQDPLRRVFFEPAERAFF